MIQAPTYAFHVDHVPGEPGTVRFLGLIRGDTVGEISITIRAALHSDEVAIAYPHCNGLQEKPMESFEVWLDDVEPYIPNCPHCGGPNAESCNCMEDWD